MLCSIEEKRIYQIIFQAVPFAAFHPETSACGSSEQGSALSEVGREITTLLRSLRSGFRYRSSLLGHSVPCGGQALHIATRPKSLQCLLPDSNRSLQSRTSCPLLPGVSVRCRVHPWTLFACRRAHSAKQFESLQK